MDSTVKNFKNFLHEKNRGLKQIGYDRCDVILEFCPIVSRAGTDICAALNQLDNLQVSKPVILVVFHHTFDPDKVLPDSNAIVNRENVLAVDCLFYENDILHCQKNENAVDKITKYLKSQNLSSYGCYNDVGRPSSHYDSDAERNNLIPMEHSLKSQCLKNWKYWVPIIVVLFLLGLILLLVIPFNNF